MSKNLRTLLSLHKQGISPDVIVLTAIDLTYLHDNIGWRFACSNLINQFFATAVVKPLKDSLDNCAIELSECIGRESFFRKRTQEPEL